MRILRGLTAALLILLQLPLWGDAADCHANESQSVNTATHRDHAPAAPPEHEGACSPTADAGCTAMMSCAPSAEPQRANHRFVVVRQSEVKPAMSGPAPHGHFAPETPPPRA
jgi:hypothetical protein